MNKFVEATINTYNKKWMLENVLKHKSCLDPQSKNYDSIDFTLTYAKFGIE